MYGITLDKQRVKNMIDDFHTVTNIRIAFFTHEQKEYISMPKEPALFCKMLRQDNHFYQKCKACDNIAFTQAQRNKSLYLYECHVGLHEAVAPILYEGELLGYLMLGQVLPQMPCEALWQQIYHRCEKAQVDFAALKDAFFKLHYLDKAKIHAAARMMSTNAKYIHLSQLIKIHQLPTIEKLKQYDKM